jgi:hypothetical protein
MPNIVHFDVHVETWDPPLGKPELPGTEGEGSHLPRLKTTRNDNQIRRKDSIYWVSDEATATE